MANLSFLFMVLIESKRKQKRLSFLLGSYETLNLMTNIEINCFDKIITGKGD